MAEQAVQTTYYSKTGQENTQRTLELARDRARQLGIDTILVASSSGATGVLAAQLLQGFHTIIVSHSTGFAGPNTQELLPIHRVQIEAAGVPILTCQHTFGGVNRAVRRKLETYELDEVVAHTLRVFGQGMKVAIEIAMMAADAGLVRTDVPAISIAGTSNGADTAVVLLPSNAQDFFDLKILEFICLPSENHPAFH